MCCCNVLVADGEGNGRCVIWLGAGSRGGDASKGNGRSAVV